MSRVVSIAVGLLAVLLLIGAYFFFMSPHYSRVLNMRMLDTIASAMGKEDLKDATYLLSPWNGGGVLHDGKLDSSLYLKRGLVAIDMAKSNEHVAMLAVDPKTQETQVILDGETIVSSGTQKSKIAISPDGSRVLYAEAEAQDSADWSVVLANASTTQVLGEGFGGVFIDDFTVVRFAEGVAVGEDLVTGEEVGSIETDIDSNRFLVAQSPDRMVLAWRGDEDAFVEAYKIVGTFPLLFEEVFFVQPVPGTLSLTQNELYVTSPPAHKKKTEIWKYDLLNLQKPVLIRTLPSHLGLTKLIP